MKPTRPAFTLVELVVLLAIVLLLVALLLPAIQRVRESSHILACSNNLRSIGQAFVLMNQSGNDVLPTAGGDIFAPDPNAAFPLPRSFTGAGLPFTRQNQDWGWAYQILPYLENEQLWKLKRSQSPAISVSAFRDQVGDAEIARTPVAAYFCPTRRSPQTVNGPGNFGERAAIDYAANAGPYATTSLKPPVVLLAGPLANIEGIPYVYQPSDPNYLGTITKSRRHYSPTNVMTATPLKYRDITDGLSSTFLIAEKRVNANRLSARTVNGTSQPGDQFGFVSGFGPDTVRLAFWPPNPDAPRGNIYYSTKGPYIQVPGDTSIDSTGQIAIPDGFGSSHLRGFNTLFADGSVRHLPFAIDTNLFRSLSWRNDGSAIDMNNVE